MKVEELTVGPVLTRCYILQEEHSSECIVIDPGDEPGRILKAVGDRTVAAILLTHGHFDHIGGVRGLTEENDKGNKKTRLMIHRLDAPMLKDPVLNAGMRLLGRSVTAPAPTDEVRDGDEGEIAGLKIRVIHTPGHTPGSVCWLVENELFTGDTLFEYGWGRTDLPGGDEHALAESLRKIIPMAQTMPFHPGH